MSYKLGMIMLYKFVQYRKATFSRKATGVNRGYQDRLNSSPLMSLRAKRSNLRHHEIVSALCAPR